MWVTSKGNVEVKLWCSGSTELANRSKEICCYVTARIFRATDSAGGVAVGYGMGQKAQVTGNGRRVPCLGWLRSAIPEDSKCSVRCVFASWASKYTNLEVSRVESSVN
jgi:hypothetical protein